MNLSDQAIAAAVAGNIPALSRLLEHGVSMSTTTEGGQSFLDIAIRQGHSDLVRFLLDRGADPRAVTSGFFTPLEMALSRSNTEMTGLLLDYGANPDDIERRGMRPAGAQGCYWIAIENNEPQQVTYLEARGWEPFDPEYGHDLFYQLLLHLPRKYDAMDFLLARGAKPWRGMWLIPDICDRLVANGLPVPPDVSRRKDFQYAPQPMTPRHFLWKAKLAIDRVGPSKDVRPATSRELMGIASFNPAPSVLEFFAHFLPTRRGAIPELTDFDGMMLQNADFYPGLSQRGYFVIGSYVTGDIYVIGSETMPGRATPPVLLVDHERYDDEMSATNPPDVFKQFSGDLVEFVKTMASLPNKRGTPKEELVSKKPCSRCGSMESRVLTGDEGPYRFCHACSNADPFTG